MKPSHFTIPEKFDALVDQLLIEQNGARLVVLIDGGSGAGKTVLATELAKVLDIRLVSMDDFYPGWDGLLDGAQDVSELVLRPDNPGYWSWDWERSTPSKWISIDPKEPLIVEGCGAITPSSAALATSTIWYQASWRKRKQSLTNRWDAENYRPFWYRWLVQEHRHWQLHRPQDLASITVTRTDF